MNQAAKHIHKLLHTPLTKSFFSTNTPATAEAIFRHHHNFTDADITYLRLHRPYLLNTSPTTLLRKLSLLSSLSLSSRSSLLRIIRLRPRLLLSLISPSPLLSSLFPSPSLLSSALLRNPSLLLLRNPSPLLSLFQSLGVSPRDLAPLLLSRPTLLSRAELCQEKLGIVRMAGLNSEMRMYRYALAVLAVSKVETVVEKIENLERFGFSREVVLTRIFARSPYVLTLSIDKVQRNMTYITALMKLPADTVLLEPQLLHYNLDTLLKPRHMVLSRLREMGLWSDVEGVKDILRAMRMKEQRFIKAFITCHKEGGVAEVLSEFYNEVKKSKRLADSARKVVHKAFPY